jgi:RHS repeat-associated protein
MAMSVVYATINGQIVSENRGGVISYYAPDNLGSTVALLDSTGTVTDTFTYWPYGEIQSHVGSSVTPFTFCGTLGYYLDVLGNFIYVRARYLRQALTRWQTVDALWPIEKSYGYVDCRPTQITDPSGNGTAAEIWDCIKKALGILWAALVGCVKGRGGAVRCLHRKSLCVLPGGAVTLCILSVGLYDLVRQSCARVHRNSGSSIHGFSAALSRR